MLINYKPSFRRLYSSVRKGVDTKAKEEFDRNITALLINSDEFKACKNILTYVSFGSEINTASLIDYSLKVDKSVYVPVWSNGNMVFYRINSRAQLLNDIHGILIPDIKNCEKLCTSENSLCIVPGLSFDKFGTRLGFGGGYYDRFLSENPSVIPVALCYERCLCADKLPYEAHDIPINMIITENSIRRRGYINGK